MESPSATAFVFLAGVATGGIVALAIAYSAVPRIVNGVARDASRDVLSGVGLPSPLVNELAVRLGNTAEVLLRRELPGV